MVGTHRHEIGGQILEVPPENYADKIRAARLGIDLWAEPEKSPDQAQALDQAISKALNASTNYSKSKKTQSREVEVQIEQFLQELLNALPKFEREGI